MAKIYSKNFTKNSNQITPKEETIRFLLDYSKALSVINCNKSRFEMLIN
ncbi:MAG: hypothetical protein ACK5MZ_03510 [Aestuariibaculum sp.]